MGVLHNISISFQPYDERRSCNVVETEFLANNTVFVSLAHKSGSGREKKVIDIIKTVRKMKWSWAGHINRLKDDRWTSRVTTWIQEKTTRETSQAVERRPRQIPERHDMAEASTIQGSLETAC